MITRFWRALTTVGGSQTHFRWTSSSRSRGHRRNDLHLGRRACVGYSGTGASGADHMQCYFGLLGNASRRVAETAEKAN